MARQSRKTGASAPIPPSIFPARGIELLRQQQETGTALLSQRPIKKEDYYYGWENTTREILVMCFGSDSQNIKVFDGIGQLFIVPDWSDSEWEAHRAESLRKQVKLLESCIAQLEVKLEVRDGPSRGQPTSTMTKKVFLVHGRNNGARETVARFLEKLSLEAIVLREQPNRGRTVIEKFLDYSDVSFAVVLLTGDDRGGLRDEPYEAQKPRARQNVMLELGFFLGALGRDRVCPLYEPGVDVPSDYQGVLFVEFDQRERWKVELAREMKAIGLPVDMNRVF